MTLGWDDEFCEEIEKTWEKNLREIEDTENVDVNWRFESSSVEDLIVCQELYHHSDVSDIGFRGFCA